jgi:hypothetical protein
MQQPRAKASIHRKKNADGSRLRKNCENRRFEDLLLDILDDALSAIGENAKKSIYLHLQQKFLIAKQDIPYKIDDFSDALEQIFGCGARSLEILIMTKLHQKIKSNYRWEGPNWLVPELTFCQYVKLLKLFYEDNQKIDQVKVIVDVEEQIQEQRV